MRHAFHPDARLEFREAAVFYDAARTGVGAAFVSEVESVIECICQAPDRWPKFEQDVRRCLTNRRFPYALPYTIEDDYTLIIAVMHCSREPGYWKDRIT